MKKLKYIIKVGSGIIISSMLLNSSGIIALAETSDIQSDVYVMEQGNNINSDNNMPQVNQEKQIEEIQPDNESEENVKSGYWGTCPWSISEDGVLTIGGGVGTDVDYNYTWEKYSREIKKINIEGNISFDEGTSLEWAFSSERVEEINGLEKLDTSNVINMREMFEGCYSLTSIDLNKLDTSNVTDMSGMFMNCSNLISVDLSELNTSNVTDMSNMFEGCYDLVSVDLSELDTSNVTDMNAMFDCCYTLSELDLSNFNTEKTTDMSGMFMYCNALKKVDISSFNTENVTSMLGMFRGCGLLTELNLSNFNTQNVKTMLMMFEDCRSLVNLDLSQFDLSNLDVGQANMLNLGKEYSIKEIVMPHKMGIETNKENNINELIKSMPMASWKDEGTGIIYNEKPDMLIEGNKYISLGQPIASGEWGTCKWSFKDGDGILTIYGGDAGDERSPWRQYSNYITKINIIGNINSAHAYCLFEDLKKLEEVNGLDKIDMSNVKEMSRMFYGCTRLKTLDTGNLNTSNVEYMTGIFAYCYKLESLNLRNFDLSSLKYIGSSTMDHLVAGAKLKKIVTPQNFGTKCRKDVISNLLEGMIGEVSWKDKTDNKIYDGKPDTLIEGHTYVVTGSEYDVDEKESITDIISDTNYKINSVEGINISVLTGIEVGDKVSVIKEQLDNDNIQICDKDGNVLDNSSIVGTGCQVQLLKNGQVIETAVIVVKGDTDGTGTINILDMEAMQKSILGINKLTGVYKNAALLNDEEQNVSVLDMEVVQKDILGIKKIVQ